MKHIQAVMLAAAIAGIQVIHIQGTKALPMIDCFKVCSGLGTDPSDQALFIRNILIQVRKLASLLH